MKDNVSVYDILKKYNDSWEMAAGKIIDLCRILIRSRYETGYKYPGSHGIRIAIVKKVALKYDFAYNEIKYLIEILARLSHSNEIHMSENLIYFCRKAYDKKYIAVPKIDLILADIFGEMVDENKIMQFLISNINATYQLEYNEGIIQDFQMFSDRFNQINQTEVPRLELFNLLLPKEYDNNLKNHSEAFVELIEILGILNAAWDLSKVRVSGSVDPDFLIIKLFGFQTNIKGLDYLFLGKILLPQKRGISAVVSGPTGSGKTVFSLSLASAICKDNGISIYFTFEQDIDSLLRILLFLNLNKDESYIISKESLTELNRKYIDTEINKKGMLLIREITKFSDMEIKHIVSRYLESNLFNNFTRKLLIFDPINTVYIKEKGHNEWRSFLYELSEKLKSKGFSLLYIKEDMRSECSTSLEPYVADIVISLDKKMIRNYKLRNLDILKARNQPIHRGKHQFIIAKETGIEVYPSPAAVLAKSSKRVIRLKTDQKPSIKAFVNNFSKYYGIEWWKEESSTVFLGESGTLKSYLAKTFIDETPISRSKVSTMSIYFGTEFSTMIEQQQRKHSMKFKFGTIVELLDKKNIRKDIFILFRVGFVSPGQVLREIERIIDINRLKGYPIQRVIISDIDNISYQYPLLRDDDEFLPALIDLLLSYESTLILVCSTKEKSFETDLQRQVESLADNILYFQHIYYAGYDYIGLSVKRSEDSSHKKGIYHLDIIDHKPVIKNTFDLLHNLRSGQAEQSKVNLTLFVETALQKEYVDTLENIYSYLNFHTVTRFPASETLSFSKISLNISPPIPSLNIIQFDNYRLRNMIYEGDLIDLSYFDESIHDFSCEFVEESISEAMIKKGNLTEVFAIPYYFNPSFLCFRKELMSDYDPERYTWADIINKATILKKKRKYRDYLVFDCPHISMENYNSLFLEICISLFSHVSKPLCLMEILESNEAIEAALILKKLLDQSIKDDFRSKEKLISVNRNSIFWRVWYCTFRQLSKDILDSGGSLDDILVAPLPKYCSMKGDWFLGILNGSSCIESGVKIIKQLSNPENSVERLVRGVGLPSQKKYYENISDEKVFSTDNLKLIDFYEIYQKSISRSDWGCYPLICSLLFKTIISIINIPSKIDKHILVEMIRRIFKENIDLLKATISSSQIKYCSVIKGTAKTSCGFQK